MSISANSLAVVISACALACASNGDGSDSEQGASLAPTNSASASAAQSMSSMAPAANVSGSGGDVQPAPNNAGPTPAGQPSDGAGSPTQGAGGEPATNPDTPVNEGGAGGELAAGGAGGALPDPISAGGSGGSGADGNDDGAGGTQQGAGGEPGGTAEMAAGGAGGDSAVPDPDPPRLCILPLGDSITQSNSDHLSYRYWLWQDLTDAGYDFDFIGSLNENFGGVPSFPNSAFDRDHEGHWGWRADEILAQLSGWLGSYTPDVVLMHLGTNDAFQNNPTDSTMTELSQVIEALRSKNPQVVVLMAKLIPSTMNQSQIDAINANIDGLASDLTTDMSPVVVVDQATGFNAGPDTFDGIHPNEGGEKKMASRWLESLVENWPASGGACDQ